MTMDNMNNKMTQKEALAYLGMTQPTFLKYAERFGAKGQREGRKTLYDRALIEKIKIAFQNQADILIRKLEMVTGGKVKVDY